MISCLPILVIMTQFFNKIQISVYLYLPTCQHSLVNRINIFCDFLFVWNIHNNKKEMRRTVKHPKQWCIRQDCRFTLLSGLAVSSDLYWEHSFQAQCLSDWFGVNTFKCFFSIDFYFHFPKLSWWCVCLNTSTSPYRSPSNSFHFQINVSTGRN